MWQWTGCGACCCRLWSLASSISSARSCLSTDLGPFSVMVWVGMLRASSPTSFALFAAPYASAELICIALVVSLALHVEEPASSRRCGVRILICEADLPVCGHVWESSLIDIVSYVIFLSDETGIGYRSSADMAGFAPTGDRSRGLDSGPRLSNRPVAGLKKASIVMGTFPSRFERPWPWRLAEQAMLSQHLRG